MKSDLTPCGIQDQDHSSLDSIQKAAIRKFQGWLKRHEGNKEPGLPHRGRNYGALVTLDRLVDNYDLDVDAHKTPSGKQVKRLTKHHVSNILEEFGETREPLEEAGRTSRGALDAAEDLLGDLQEAGLTNISGSERRRVLISMMRHCVWVEGQYHERARVEIDFNPSDNASQAVSKILEDAGDRKRGPVAQHLVGAKLALRLPERKIPNHSAYTADVQTGRRGDFDIADTVFHVTVTPSDRVYQKCKSNIDEGYYVYLIVSDEVRSATEDMAHQHSDKIRVESVESFVGQNMDEISSFSREKFQREFRGLLEVYNERVKEVESDKAILINIPDNLS